MKTVPPPAGHPDRALLAQESLQPAYDAMVSKMVAQGWAEKDVALAMVGLSEAHAMALESLDVTEAQLAWARAIGALPPIEPQPERKLPPPYPLATRLAFVAGAAVTGGLMLWLIAG